MSEPSDDPRPKSKRQRPARPADAPSHPPLAAALLMIGIVVFLVLVAFLSVR